MLKALKIPFDGWLRHVHHVAYIRNAVIYIFLLNIKDAHMLEEPDVLILHHHICLVVSAFPYFASLILLDTNIR